MKRTELLRKTPLGSGDKPLRRGGFRKPGDNARRSGIGVPKRNTFTPATDEQRLNARTRGCVISSEYENVDAAHIIPRGMTTVGQDDPRATVGLRRDFHRKYDDGDLSILEYLEPYYRAEIAFAVERMGLITALQRITNCRWQPIPSEFPEGGKENV
jgi:hypothetical protein